MKKFALRPLVAALVLTAPVMSAFATDGYFSHGYGMKAKGMGGASIASTDNAFAGANNPATSAWAGNRFEAGVDWFSPKRSASRTGTQGGFADGNLESGSNNFLIPEFGYNKQLDGARSFGVTVYGNGGMNTDYPVDQGFGQSVLGSTGMGVDMVQLVVAPTFAMKLDDKHSVGISPLFIVQQFSVKGVHNFSAAHNLPAYPQGMPRSSSINPEAMTNRGYDQSTGLGVRLGYLGKVTPQLNLGVSYSPKTKMSKFGDYEGFFADAGSFDIPENYVVGLSYQANSQWLVAMDYQRINYGDVASIANPGSNMFPVAAFGSPQGAGFGWKSINVIKLGTEWKYSTNLTLRAGLNLSDNPIGSSEVGFNRMAPGVITTHYTLGGTYALSPTTEVTGAYMHAPENSVSGTNPALDNTNETIRMSQQSLGIQFGWKF
jgi:long-chain fatty acid transport protein